ncbi:MAG: GNAT family N-acetyltransferase [Aliivibrio sp.]|uniref:GNAT family N-acetyltransferase n=1 Tax=Aliivibrio sp. TaxID=1872443 RepID=UPI001A47DD2D|nr:GNAT family N-acetyltransferase [Aliivibrio sp.]
MEIITTRLTMTPITQKDWPLFLQLHQEPEVISLCFDEMAVEVVKEKFETRLSPWNPDGDSWLCLVITDKLSGKAIGITGFTLIDGVAEVGYLLLPEFHGKQYGTESLSALLDWAVDTHQITNYKAVVTEGNIGSERVLIKCGFTLKNVVDNAYEIDGQWYADHHYQRS